MRVLIAPDKFKGTLTAREAAAAMARGWKRVRPQDQLVLTPISDGGDGFGGVVAELRNAKPVRTVAVDAAGRRCVVRWWWERANRVAIIESARVIGLAMLPPKRFHPFELDTRGLAAVLRSAAKRGAKRCLIGVGGSATNDGGFGLACGLGWRFLDRFGRALERWTDLDRLTEIVAPCERTWPREVIVAVDVQNRLLGPHGCARVYGPQKGLRAADFPKAEACLRRLARVVRATLGEDIAGEPGAGAAGGLGFGLAAFADARLEPGFDLLASLSAVDEKLRRADLVVTGEGRVDRSSLMGKGVGELSLRCRKLGVPCIALGGCASDRKLLKRKFSDVRVLTDMASSAQARAGAKLWLEKLAAAVARQIHLKQP